MINLNLDKYELMKSLDGIDYKLNILLEKVNVNKAYTWVAKEFYDLDDNKSYIELCVNTTHLPGTLFPKIPKRIILKEIDNILDFLKELNELSFPTIEDYIELNITGKDLTEVHVSLDILKKYKLYTHKDFYKFTVFSDVDNYLKVNK